MSLDVTTQPTATASRPAPEPGPAWRHWRMTPFQLVLEGGAMRGMFTCGVVDFLLDHGLLAESVVGVSIGASCGFSYASGVAGQTARMIVSYRDDWRFMSVRSKLRCGDYVGGEFIFDTIPYRLERIPTWLYSQSPMRLVSVATDIETGKPDYHELAKGRGHATEARYLMASAALPCANRPVDVDGKLLLDGGIARPVPFAYGRERYRGRQVVVLTRPRGYRPDSDDPAVPIVRMRTPRTPRWGAPWPPAPRSTRTSLTSWSACTTRASSSVSGPRSPSPRVCPSATQSASWLPTSRGSGPRRMSGQGWSRSWV